MNCLSWLASIVAGGLAAMMTVVSWRVLKGNPVLDNPVIHVGVGVLTFIGLRYRPGGLIGTILFGYEAVPIAILFLLLWTAFQRVSQARKVRKQQELMAGQASQLRAGKLDLQKPKTRSGYSKIRK